MFSISLGLRNWLARAFLWKFWTVQIALGPPKKEHMEPKLLIQLAQCFFLFPRLMFGWREWWLPYTRGSYHPSCGFNLCIDLPVFFVFTWRRWILSSLYKVMNVSLRVKTFPEKNIINQSWTAQNSRFQGCTSVVILELQLFVYVQRALCLNWIQK